MTTQARTLNLGIVGLGQAGAGVPNVASKMENVKLIGAADTNPRSLQSFQERYGARTYDSIEAICNDPDIDTLWIATPNAYHTPHTVMAAEHGKNVIIEKPMAISLADAEKMIEATDKAGVQLLCGGSRSSSAVVRKMREIVVSGQLGPLRAMTTWASTDWMLRPRRPDEYDLAYGGGVAFRQSPHMVDSVRLIAGGRVRNVRGVTGAWMAPRNTAPGFFSAILEFEDGPFATLVYDAYGYFMASEFFEPGTGGPDAPGLEGRLQNRREITTGSRDETALKEQRVMANNANRGNPQAAAAAAGFGRSGYLSDLGLLHVACEQGEMRQSPNGLYVYTNAGTEDLSLSETRGSSSSPELEELYNAVVNGKPLLHGGRWGLATLEVSIAIMDSAREHRDIMMQHQVSVPAGY